MGQATRGMFSGRDVGGHRGMRCTRAGLPGMEVPEELGTLGGQLSTQILGERARRPQAI